MTENERKATICIVNYKTPQFTRLCLRSVRKFTKFPYEVLVIDNNSADESLDYLRKLRWIKLIERDTSGDSGGGYSHAAALDLGLEYCESEFFVSLHTDTFVQRAGWLSDLIAYFDNEQVASVGSGKLELTPIWELRLKRMTDLKGFWRKISSQTCQKNKYSYYNRTEYALYRTSVLKKEGLGFQMGRDKGLGAGKKLYFELLQRGYKTVELSAEVMRRYVVHLAHATQAVNAGEFSLRKRTIDKTNRRIDKLMHSPQVQQILRDNSLDQ
ncbi:MAG: glycosyltransferase [Phycisphaerae bacterium]|nr:glycosyltransferase [Phycisphaerae bacterium]